MKLPPKAFRFISPRVRALSGPERDAWNLWVDRGTQTELTPRAAAVALRVVNDLNGESRAALAKVSDRESDLYVGLVNDIAYFESLKRALSGAIEPVAA